MKKKRVQVMKYLDAKMVEDLHKAVGIAIPQDQHNANMGDDIDEDINEEF